MPDDVFAALRGVHTQTIALKRDLEVRASRWTRPGYHYQGSADLFLKHGTFFTGRQLPDKYVGDVGNEGECFSNALAAAKKYPELRYFEGVYSSHGAFTSHAWCVDQDDQMVELTWPTSEDRREIYRDRSGMGIIHPERMAYVGVELQPELIDWFGDTYGEMCLFDRPPSDAEAAIEAPHLDMTQDHDFPILKVPYDPARTSLPDAP